MTIENELNQAQSKVLQINFEVSTGVWDGPDIASPTVLPNCYGADISNGVDQSNAAATFLFTTMPGLAINAPIQFFAGYNGEGVVIFKGEVASRAWEFAPGKFALVCRDRLARTREGWAGADAEYAGQDDAVIIRNVLEKYGLPSTAMSIESSGLTLGVVQEVVLTNGAAGYDLISSIDQITPYRTYTDGTGVIRRKNIFATVAGTPTWGFVQGVNIVSIKRDQDPRWPNQMTVSGLAYEGLEVSGQATTDNPAIFSPPGLLSDSVSSPLVETDTIAGQVAQVLLNLKRTYSEKFEIGTFGNPLIQPLQLVHIEAAGIGFDADSIVESVRHSITAGAWTTTIRTIGILNGDGATSGFDPIAIAAATVDQEAVYDPTLAVRYFANLNGRASYDTDGRIVSWAWSVPGGTPSSGTGPEFATRAADLTGLTATLTVTDEQGLVGVTSISLDPADQPAKTRQLAIAAAGAGLVFLADGSATPLEFPRGGQECLSVPPIFAGRPLGGWDDGALTRVDVGLAGQTVLHTFPDAVRAIWVNEANTDHILVGAGPELWRSTDDGATWTLLHTFADDIRDLQSSPTQLNDIRVLSGASLWQSGDAATFTALVTGEPGTTAMMLGSAGWGNAVVFKDAPSAGYTIKFESGSATVDWSGVTSPPTSLHSITPNLVDQGYTVGDDTGRTFKLAPGGSGYIAALAVTLGTGNMAGDLQRDGTMAGIAYAAANGGTGGAWKIVNQATALELYQGDILQVGYGDLVSLVAVYEALWPTWGGTAPGIWHYAAGAWARIPFPLTDRPYYCYGIAANRVGNQVLTVWSTSPTPRAFGANEWWYHDVSGAGKVAMRGSSVSPLWHLNLDTGVWTEIQLSSPHPGPYTYTPDNGAILLHVPVWATDSDDRWVITRSGDVISGGTSLNSWWRGQGTYVGPVISDLSGIVDEYTAAAVLAPGGDLVLYEYIPSNQLRVAAVGASVGVDVGSTTAAGPGGDGRVAMIDQGPGMVWAMDDGSIYVTPDYTDTTPTLALAGIGASIAWATHGVYVGRRSDLYKITDILGTPAGSTAVAGAVTYVRSDAQERTTVLAIQNLAGGGLAASLDGTTWDTIARPAGVASGELSLYAAEPLRR